MSETLNGKSEIHKKEKRYDVFKELNKLSNRGLTPDKNSNFGWFKQFVDITQLLLLEPRDYTLTIFPNQYTRLRNKVADLYKDFYDQYAKAGNPISPTVPYHSDNVIPCQLLGSEQISLIDPADVLKNPHDLLNEAEFAATAATMGKPEFSIIAQDKRNIVGILLQT